MRRFLPAIAAFIVGCGPVESEQSARFRGAVAAWCEEAAAAAKRAESPYQTEADIAAQERKAEEAWSRIPEPPPDKSQVMDRVKTARKNLGLVVGDVTIATMASLSDRARAERMRKEAVGKAGEVRREIESIRLSLSK